ncbi:exocyst subunit exo70 family protein E1 [Raphanus sativus]|uniref:Exocyst subunit Exo70 family protein n=1 Tax=Raphanus sativus TaxID=3726 RepID=A0A9W3BY79_RAPSA|nr:exocyst complex component EXO70E2 [Raphanus sativus]KAJ4888161.1 exocyst subunit exo70 family protein E1 [Raphanus sativus]
MGECEVDGEEKLIAAANYLLQELRSGKSLSRNAKKALGSLLSELSRVVVAIPEDNNRYEGDEIETRLNLVCEKIMTREVDETMIWDLGSDAGSEFLDAVNELRVLIDRLDGTEEEVSLRKAHDVLQTAMARLEDEFKHLLVENRLPFELEHASFRSEQALGEGSFGAASTEDLILGSSNGNNNSRRRNSEEILVRPEVISDLKSIAETMFASGYDRECIQVCTTVRKQALDEFLYDHEVEKLSIEDVLKMDWATLNTNIKKWVRVMRNIVQVYLVSEKSLLTQIFGEETCFVDTVKAPVMQLLNFGEAVSLGPRQPEKLLRILEMYELASELLPEIDALFSESSSVRGEYREVMRRLGDCARATFLEFKGAIASDVSSHPFPGGAVHPLTNYVMNYLMALTDFSQTLDSLLMEHDDVEDLTIPPSPDVMVVVEEESAYENSSSTSPEKFLAMTKHFYSITSVLESNLEEKAKLYRDVSLRHIFLLNNIHYMTRKVLKSELKHIFGDKWNRKHTWKFQQQATEYERSTWLPVLSFLKDDASGSGSGSGSRSLKPRERFQGFNTAFEEVYKAQTGWLISDERLREDVRTKASMWVIQAYWTFYSRHKNSVSERYIKYSTDDLEKLLLDLFAGSSKSLNNSYRR